MTTVLVMSLFVAGPLLAGFLGAEIAAARTWRRALVWGLVGGLAFGLNLAAFGGFLYGPLLGTVGGLVRCLLGFAGPAAAAEAEPPAALKGAAGVWADQRMKLF